jgi:DNA mismatch repair protein MutS
VEKILDNTNYIPNDVNFINNKINGMLLYGLNGGGKSVFMKSIGINIVLAQAGIFIAAENFEYHPYNKIFTRINKNDNLFMGKSSFEIEMMELKTILNIADKNSLVIGDEVCSTTENISGLSIISTTINYFLKNDISFIFASHIPDINNYINKDLIDKIYIGHLTVEIEKNKMIYTRKIKDGIGNKNYGLMVANFIFNDKEFEINSLQTQNKILDKHNQKNSKTVVSTSKSTYNKKLYVDYCYICKDVLNVENKNNLDVHHIKEQNTFEKNESKIKNKKSNLVVLCKLHHTNVHKNQIKINGWVKTSDGIKLDYA